MEGTIWDTAAETNHKKKRTNNNKKKPLFSFCLENTRQQFEWKQHLWRLVIKNTRRAKSSFLLLLLFTTHSSESIRCHRPWSLVYGPIGAPKPPPPQLFFFFFSLWFAIAPLLLLLLPLYSRRSVVGILLSLKNSKSTGNGKRKEMTTPIPPTQRRRLANRVELALQSQKFGGRLLLYFLLLLLFLLLLHGIFFSRFFFLSTNLALQSSSTSLIPRT